MLRASFTSFASLTPNLRLPPCNDKDKKVDDSLLDEEDPPLANTASTSVEASLKSIAAQLASLNSRVQTMESARSSSEPSAKVGPSTASKSVDTAGHSEGEVSDAEDQVKESAADEEPDASYVELLQGIKTLLDIEDPHIQTFQPPTVFKAKESQKTSKLQQSAFPPDQDIHLMWAFKHSQATGKDATGITAHPPLHMGQFIQFSKVNMQHYVSLPQLSTLRAPEVPESFKTLANRKTPTHVSTPWNQHKAQEKVLREVTGFSPWCVISLSSADTPSYNLAVASALRTYLP